MSYIICYIFFKCTFKIWRVSSENSIKPSPTSVWLAGYLCWTPDFQLPERVFVFLRKVSTSSASSKLTFFTTNAKKMALTKHLPKETHNAAVKMKLHNINIWRFWLQLFTSQAGWRRGSRWRTSRWRLSSWPNVLPVFQSVQHGEVPWYHTCACDKKPPPRTQTTRADPCCCCLSGGWSYWRAARGWVWRSRDFPAVSSCSGPAVTPGCSSQAWRSQTAPAASLLPPRFQVAWRDDGCRPRKPRRCCFLWIKCCCSMRFCSSDSKVLTSSLSEFICVFGTGLLMAFANKYVILCMS